MKVDNLIVQVPRVEDHTLIATGLGTDVSSNIFLQILKGIIRINIYSLLLPSSFPLC